MTKYKINAIKEFCYNVFKKQGMEQEYYEIVTDVLVEAHIRGAANQGLGRLPQYIKRMGLGLINTNPQLTVEKELPSIVVLNANHSMGHYAGYTAMNIAIKKAKETGICAVAVKDSTHFGVTGYYTRMAALSNMIGIAITNSTALMAPFGGADCIIGNNPISIAAPTKNGKPILLDMACSNAAYSSIQQAAQTGEQVPLGWGRDKNGNDTQNAKEIMEGTLLPSGGYKGYGLAVMLDILAGVLTGSGYTSGVTHLYKNLKDKQRTGHFMIAINPDMFMGLSIFFDRMNDFESTIVNSRKAPESDSISIPGHREEEWREEATKTGIALNDAVVNQLNELATMLDIPSLSK